MLAKLAVVAVAALAAANGCLAKPVAGATPGDALAAVHDEFGAIDVKLAATEDGFATEIADADLAVVQNLLFFADVAGASYKNMVISFVKAICDATVPDILDAHKTSIYVRPWKHCPHGNYEAVIDEFQELVEELREKETSRWNNGQFDVNQPYDLAAEMLPEATLLDSEIPANTADNTLSSVDIPAVVTDATPTVPAPTTPAVPAPTTRAVAVPTTPAIAAQTAPAVAVAETLLDNIKENVSSGASVAHFSAIGALPAVVWFSAAVSAAMLLF